MFPASSPGMTLVTGRTRSSARPRRASACSASRGSGIITVRVCFGYLARTGRHRAGGEPGGADELVGQRRIVAVARPPAGLPVHARALDAGGRGGQRATEVDVAVEAVPRRVRPQGLGSQVRVRRVAEEPVVAEHVPVDLIAARLEQAEPGQRVVLDAALAVRAWRRLLGVGVVAGEYPPGALILDDVAGHRVIRAPDYLDAGPDGRDGCVTRRVRVVVRLDQVALDDRAGPRGAARATAVLRRRRVVVVLRVRRYAGPVEPEHRVLDDQLSACVGAGIPERGVDPGVVRERGIADPGGTRPHSRPHRPCCWRRSS